MIGSLGVGAGTLALGGCGAPAAAPAAPAATASADRWQRVRAEFQLAPDRVHMASFFLVSHPRPVRDAIERHRRGLDDDPYNYIEDNVARLETEVRRSAADYVGGSPDALAMTDSTTMGLGVVYGGLVLRPGQEILTTTHDHIVTYLALEHRAARGDATIRKISLYDDPARASADEIATRLERALKPATRIVAVTWVHSGTGVKLPVRAMADVIARANAKRADADRILLCVDGVHGFGNQDVAVSELGCDFFVAGCHKWIFGPRGTGLVWGSPEGWRATRPTIPSMDPLWRGAEPQPPPASLMTPGGFHSFEHRWALPAAFEFHRELGRAAVAARIAELNDRCKQALAAIRGVKVMTPASRELSAGIVCFDVAGKNPRDVVAALRKRGIVASVTPPFYEPMYVRYAPSLLTLEADIDRAVAALAEVAR